MFPRACARGQCVRTRAAASVGIQWTRTAIVAKPYSFASIMMPRAMQGNAECQVRNAELQCGGRTGNPPIEPMPADLFRIPYSAFRINPFRPLSRSVPLPAPGSLLPLRLPAPRSPPYVALPNGCELNHSSPNRRRLTSASVMEITMKLLRRCYTPRPCGPPRLVGLRHDCCEVQRCVHAMAVRSALATRHASRLAISS